MTPDNRLVQQAKSGDTAAIAQLLNRQLGDRGIHAEVTPAADGLAIALSSSPQAPPWAGTVGYLTNAFQRLNAPSIHHLQVSGWQTGAHQATWQQTITFKDEAAAANSIPPPSSTFEASAPKSEPTISAKSKSQIATAADKASTPSKAFNARVFRLSWLLATVPFVWLYFWMPQVLYRFDSTGDNRFQYLLDHQQWILIVPLAIGQWWLLRRHLRSAYWWAIAIVIVFYFEMYPRGLLSYGLIRLAHSLPAPLTPILNWSPNAIRGFAIGLLLGMSQWFLLRRSLSPLVKAAPWIWISAISWTLGLGLPILTQRFMPNFFAISPRLFWPVAEVLQRLSTGIGPLFLAVITGSVLAHWLQRAGGD